MLLMTGSVLILLQYLRKIANSNHLANYQPMNLTSQVAKILESIARDTMQDFLTEHNIINVIVISMASEKENSALPTS